MIKIILILIIVYLVMRDKSLQDKVIPIYQNIVNTMNNLINDTKNNKHNAGDQIEELIKNNT